MAAMKTNFLITLILVFLQAIVGSDARMPFVRKTSLDMVGHHHARMLSALRGGADFVTPDCAQLLAALKTGAAICVGSDVVAQCISKVTTQKDSSFSVSRTCTTGVVGTFFLGICSPLFYDNVKVMFPGQSLGNSLVKLLLGQVFAAAIAMSYFATSLDLGKGLSPESLLEKTKDLPKFALFSVVYWGILFNLLDRKLLPALVFVWTTVLDMVAFS